MKKIAVILTLALILLLAAGCSQQPVSTVTVPTLLQPEKQEPALAEVTRDVFYYYTAHETHIVPYTQPLYFSISGVVGQVFVYPGKMVEKGDVLAVLDHSDLTRRAETLEAEIAHTQTSAEYSDKLAQLTIRILEAELRQLEAQLAEQDNAETQLSRQIALKKNEIAQAKADLRQEQVLRNARMAPKYEELETIREEIAQCYLYAPFSGRIAYETTLVAGQTVSHTQQVLALSDDSRMLLDPQCTIMESLIDAAVSIHLRIGSSNYDVKWIPPTEQEMLIAEQHDSFPRTYFEILGTPEELAQLEFGQFGILSYATNYQEDVITVPISAVQKDENRNINFVYVHENGMRVLREVEIGSENGYVYHITDGLKEGEIIYVG